MIQVQQNIRDIEDLKLVETEVSDPARNEVQVNIKAASLNYLDLILVNGSFGPELPNPYVPLSDGAGVVTKVGEGVKEWNIGDKVYIHYVRDWINGPITPQTSKIRVGLQTQGILSEFVNVPQHGLVKAPENLSFEEASTLPIAGVTAWSGLFETGNLQAGQTVLTQGTGGVSIFALQFAKAAGAKVIATTSTKEKMDFLSNLGADEVINYKENPDWSKSVKELTDGIGVDITLDIAGDATIRKSLEAIKMNGIVGTVGFITGSKITIDVVEHLDLRMAKLMGISTGSKASSESMVQAIEVNEIKPKVDKIFGFSEVKSAFRYLESGSHIGKVVIKL
ncbi:NAD(P)-dependent alcohol dehydrogenase [Gracilimonas sp.]|uniref:zinc-dependent alcohol dehydrogenase family protein n=1 Tax=Gracilimonas sp. TaxID=1974203 RepID=UPI0032EF8CA3